MGLVCLDTTIADFYACSSQNHRHLCDAALSTPTIPFVPPLFSHRGSGQISISQYVTEGIEHCTEISSSGGRSPDSAAEIWRAKIFKSTCSGRLMRRSVASICSSNICRRRYVLHGYCTCATCIYILRTCGASSLPIERCKSCARPRLVLPDRIFCCHREVVSDAA